MTLSRKQNKRKGLRLNLTNTISQLHDALRNDASTIAVLTGLSSKLQKIIENLEALDEEILDLLKEEQIEDDMAESAGCLEPTHELLAEVSIKVEGLRLENVSSVDNRSESAASKSSTASGVKCRLPKFELPVFVGDPLTWQGFWDQFLTAIHNNDSLSDIDRFNYLKRYLGGQASNTISGLMLGSENYQEAINILCERYGHPQVLITAHVESLLNMQKIKDKNDIVGLRKLYNDIENCIRNLKALKLDTVGYGCVLIPILKQKLPEDLNIIIARKFGSELWTLDLLLRYFHDELRAQENCVSVIKPNNLPKHKIPPYTANNLFAENNVEGRGSRICLYCERKGHSPSQCRIVTNVATRKAIVKSKFRCYICLSKDHISKDCEAKYVCNKCQGRHHISICQEEKGVVKDKGQKRETQNNHVNVSGSILLQTAVTKVLSTSGKKFSHARILFDSGSQRSYVTDKIRKKLNAQTIRSERVVIKTFGDSNSCARSLDVVQLQVKHKFSSQSTTIEALCVPNICQPVVGQRVSYAKNKYPHLQALQLADAGAKDGNVAIEILIGLDYYHCFLTGNVVRAPMGPVASESVLGWILSGSLKDLGQNGSSSVLNASIESSDIHLLRCSVEEVDDLRVELSKFWNVENVNDGCVVTNFTNDIFHDGLRYVTKLPFKPDHEELPDNFVVCKKRLQSLRHRLGSQNILYDYDKVFKDYENNGIIEKVPNNEIAKVDGTVHYLPHRPVLREDKSTTKIRAVFDASCSRNGVSLNQCLYAGPNLLANIFEILIRFRINEIAILADIKQAFLNVGIHKEHQDYLRFLWYDLENPERLIVYRFLRAVFGVTSSPFLLNATIRHHLEGYRPEDIEFVDKFLSDLYVDDTATGCHTVPEGVEFFHKAIDLMKKAGFELRKWLSNDFVLQKYFDTHMYKLDHESESHITFSEEQLGTLEAGTKVLGVHWDVSSDVFVFSFTGFLSKAKALPMTTKRGILKLSASMYDPLGFISPVTSKIKAIFQLLCKDKQDWDEEVPANIMIVWQELLAALETIGKVEFPRFVILSVNEVIETVELHGFSDSSKEIYCGVIYLRVVSSNGVKVSFLCAKTKVAPLKALTIPRLELLGCVLLSNLIRDVKGALVSRVIINRVYCWTDSKVALCWIKGKEKMWKPWVENRVVGVRKEVPRECWNHVSGSVNPADVPTRVATELDHVFSGVWKNGPSFLCLRELGNLVLDVDVDLSGASVEMKKAGCSDGCRNVLESTDDVTADCAHLLYTNQNATVDCDINLHNVIDSTRFSSLKKLVRVTAYVFRFIDVIKKIRQRCNSSEKVVSVEEYEHALSAWILSEQVKLSKESSFKKMSSSLNLFKDKLGIYRLRGRFNNSDLLYSEKFPVIVRDGRSYFTKLIVLDAHEQVMHHGVESTLCYLRSKYWLVKGRRTVKEIIRRCVVCKRFQGRVLVPPSTPDLPDFRINYSISFQAVGLDYAGPLFVKDNTKVYILLLTCASSRAVHLELTPTMTVGAFLRGFRRFIARRGLPKRIIHDNFKTFRSDDVKNFMLNHGVTQQFILPASPWWGGFYERLVRTVKSTLRKTLRKSSLTFEQLQTVLCEVEAVVNNRPLTYVSEDDLAESITPNHLIYGRNLLTNDVIENKDITLTKLVCKNRATYMKDLISNLWCRFSKEYLNELRQSNLYRKTKSGDVNVVINDVVLIKDDNPLPRSQWRIGKVVDLVRGNDGKVRGVELIVQSKNGKRTKAHRPLQKIIPFEVVDDSTENANRQAKNITTAIEKPVTGVNESCRSIENTHNSSSTRACRRAAKEGQELRRLRLKYQ